MSGDGPNEERSAGSGDPAGAGSPIGRGVKLLHDPVRNKGTAFSEAERDALGLRGLLPPRIHSQAEQVRRVLENLRNEATDLERYIYLVGLQDRNEVLFYRVVMDHIEELMPLIYTPTVGKACQEFGHIFRRSRGLYISLEDRGRIADVMRNWPHAEARMIVVTDGERILGLGDLGADGMGIPIGKLALYTACAGVHPTQCLPITLDVGTNNESLLADPLYLGLARKRLRGEAYDDFIEEFVQAAGEVFPRAVVQLEDFGNANAFRLLERYRGRICTFDDDIQGTASVALAGIYSSLRITEQPLADQRLLFLGAGEAGLGIGALVESAMVAVGLERDEARRRCAFFDSKGLLVASRADLAEHKRPYAHDLPATDDVLKAIETLRPTMLIGVSGQPGLFTREVVEAMARQNERPVLFALSNPTSKAECSAEQAYGWSEGRAVFASGSPFDPVELGGRRFVPGQGNNAYVFPGVGLGVLFCEASRVTDEMFFAAARELADQVTEDDLAQGRVYPALSRIRDVSSRIATRVAEVAYEQGLAARPRPADLLGEIRASMFEPTYADYA
jgi:malate dehydrogenase (oxaloacetate-decarboxylating)(NADP+)